MVQCITSVSNPSLFYLWLDHVLTITRPTPVSTSLTNPGLTSTQCVARVTAVGIAVLWYVVPSVVMIPPLVGIFNEPQLTTERNVYMRGIRLSVMIIVTFTSDVLSTPCSVRLTGPSPWQ